MKKIKVLIADDHAMFVDGIEQILKGEDEIQVVGKCFDGKSAIEFVQNHEVDLILLDINLPEMTGIEVCQKIKEENIDVKILAITMFNEESFVTEILNHGAKGYILKNTGRAELLKAIHTVMKGKSYFSEDVTQTIMKGLMKRRKSSKEKEKSIPKISRREKEVLRLIIQEHTTQEIADLMFISLKTVESHRSSLLNKLDARNTAGLVRIALENKLLD